MTPFFRTCFHPSRLVDGICLADLVRSWARHHPPADLVGALAQLDGLLAITGEDDLRVRVLGAARCGYDPGMHGMSMHQWLGLVRDLLQGRPDWGLPAVVWEPLRPWPQPAVGPLEALQRLVAAYFHEGWMVDDPTFEAVVERFVAHEGPARAAELVGDIDELLAVRPTEEFLRILVLGRLRSCYDPRPDLPGGHTMGQWLRAVRGVAVSATVDG